MLGTFSNSTPLIIIDNIQYATMDVFNSLSTTDIESISVLKDASTSSIYSARGANGVIVVTTKNGKPGPNGSILYNSYFGVQAVTVASEFQSVIADNIPGYTVVYRGGKFEVFPISQSEMRANASLVKHLAW